MPNSLNHPPPKKWPNRRISRHLQLPTFLYLALKKKKICNRESYDRKRGEKHSLRWISHWLMGLMMKGGKGVFWLEELTNGLAHKWAKKGGGGGRGKNREIAQMHFLCPPILFFFFFFFLPRVLLFLVWGEKRKAGEKKNVSFAYFGHSAIVGAEREGEKKEGT